MSGDALVLPLVDPGVGAAALTSTAAVRALLAGSNDEKVEAVLLAYRREVMQGVAGGVLINTAAHTEALVRLLRNLIDWKTGVIGGFFNAVPAGVKALVALAVQRAGLYARLAAAVQDAHRGLAKGNLYACLVTSALTDFVSERAEEAHDRADVRLGAALFRALHRVLPATAAFAVVAKQAAQWLPEAQPLVAVELADDGAAVLSAGQVVNLLRDVCLDAGVGAEGLAVGPASWHQRQRSRWLRTNDSDPPLVQTAPLGPRDWELVEDREWLGHCIRTLQRDRGAMGQLSSLLNGTTADGAGELDASARWQSKHDGPAAATVLEMARRLVGLVQRP